MTHRGAGTLRTGGLRLEVAALFGALMLAGMPGRAQPPASPSALKVHAHTLEHQPAHEALAIIRPLLSPAGTVEEQPGSNTLVIRDRRQVIDRIVPVLERFDHPPRELRFDIRLVRAGPKPKVSPPRAAPEVDTGLSEELVARLRTLLRYEDYRILAKAEMSTREGEEVTYSLGQTYSVSFRPGTVLGGSAAQRLKLEGFRILKHVENPTSKGRQLEPRELFHATLNLWLDRPFNLVLAQDASRQEALMIAISCRREGDGP